MNIPLADKHGRRRCGSRVAFGALVAVLSAGCASDSAAPSFTQQTEPWQFAGIAGRRITTDHFQINSTLTDTDLEAHLPAFLEAAHVHYATLLPAGAEESDPLVGYVFQTRRQWERFTQRFTGARARTYLRISTGGYTHRGVSVVYNIRRDPTLAVIAHEGLHQYVARRFDEPIPAWLNEGLACYVESVWFDGTRLTLRPVRNRFRRNHLREAVIEKRLFALTDLLDTHAGRVLHDGGDRVAAYYAQAWALVLFLRDGPVQAYRKGFSRLLADAGKVPLPRGEDAFREYVAPDLDAFEEQYRRFIRSLVFPHDDAGPPMRGGSPGVDHSVRAIALLSK